MKKDRIHIAAADFEILAELKPDPAMWEQVKRLAEFSGEKDPTCRLADYAMDEAGQALKLESLRGWARSSSKNADDERAKRGGGQRSKKTPEMA